jgi:hypothetical protein
VREEHGRSREKSSAGAQSGRTVGIFLGDGGKRQHSKLLADMNSAGVSMLSGRVL